ncbi:MAG: STN domain-containing protein, partial [Steroidobacteraceae bacterium]
MLIQSDAATFRANKSRKHIIRAAILCALGLTATTATLARAADGVSYRFDIAQQPLPQALRKYAQTAGQEIVFTENLFDGTKPVTLQGDYTAADALEQLLQGTGLIYERSPSGAIMIMRPGESATLNSKQSDAVVRMAQSENPGSREDSVSSASGRGGVAATASGAAESTPAARG